MLTIFFCVCFTVKPLENKYFLQAKQDTNYTVCFQQSWVYSMQFYKIVVT